jgi:hypothetical protein
VVHPQAHVTSLAIAPALGHVRRTSVPWTHSVEALTHTPASGVFVVKVGWNPHAAIVVPAITPARRTPLSRMAEP